MLRTSMVHTSHAEIAVMESGGRGLPVLLLHGNSSCKEVFARQLESPMADTYHMIAIDLPGHGKSSDAFDPRRTYSMPGYADMAIEVLRELGVGKAAVFGWSLGGHIALELIPRFPGLVGLMITGTPPVHPTPESLMGGYRPHPMVPVIGQEALSDADEALFADTVYGAEASDLLRAALHRTDGRTRRMVLESAFDGSSSDQRALAENAGMPIAILNGASDPIINIDYICGLSYATLWRKHCYAFRGVGHAPFLTHPHLFNPLFEAFLDDMAALAGRRATSDEAKISVA